MACRDWIINFVTHEDRSNGLIDPSFELHMRIKPDFRVDFIDFCFVALHSLLQRDAMEFIRYVSDTVEGHERIREGLDSVAANKILDYVDIFLKNGLWYEEEKLVEKTKYRNLPLLLCDLETTVGRRALEHRFRESR